MNLHIKRQLQVCVLAAAVIGGLTTTSQAGIIPWLYDAVFGPPGSMMQANYGYGATYGTAYRGYYGSSAYGYGAGYGYGYAPAAAGCNSCGVNTATYYGPVGYGSTGTCCATNDCNVPPPSQTTTNRPNPVDNGPEPDKTLNDDATDETDDGFRPRGAGNDAPPAATNSFKIPAEGEIVPQKPAPADEDAAEEEKTDEPQAEQLKVPALNLDTAMTTRPVVAHHRTAWHARFVTPTIARTTRAIHADWIPVSTETRIAGK